MNKYSLFSIASLVIGVIGLTVFFKPILEIICGIGGMIFAIFAKSSEESMLIYGIRRCGLSIAVINILWVCIEFGLKFAGFDLF